MLRCYRVPSSAKLRLPDPRKEYVGRRKSPAAGWPTGLFMLCRCLGMLVRGKGSISPNTYERPPGIPHSAAESYGLGFESQFFGSQKMEGEGEGFVAALGSRLWQN